MAKHKAAAAAGADPAGEAWQAEATRLWNEAEAEAARVAAEFRADVASSTARARKEAARARRSAYEIYGSGPALPDFRKAAAKHIEGVVLGRFVFQPDRNLVHDVTTATPQCEVERTPRVFVHFAHELEQYVPAEAEPHSCMAGAG